MTATLPRRALVELLGTGLLLAVVVGSGLMAGQRAPDAPALALLANTAATVAGLYVLIGLFAPLSGAHFNPLVSLLLALERQLPWRELPAYALAQLLGACAGTLLAHAMFDQPLLQWASQLRGSTGLWLAEAVATALLLLVVLRTPAAQAPARVAATLGAAYWFTASTSFANPAATVGRMLSDSFAGIAPSSVAGFVLAQSLGAVLAWGLHRALPTATAPALQPVGSEGRH